MPRRRRPDLELSVEEVTPEIAEKWLEWNDRNRKLSKRLVATYAETMRCGEWRLNGEPIIFDKTGRLQSGQHRLHAVIEADTAIWTVVVRGADAESLYTLDAGRKRTLADALTLRGETDVMNLSTAIVWAWRYQNDLMDRPGETATTAHLLTVFDETGDTLKDCLPTGRRLRAAVGFGVGLWTAVYWILVQIDTDDAEVFVERIISGANLDETDPVLALRRWCNTHKPRPGMKTSPVVVAAVIFKSWNAFREHRSVSAFGFKGSEAFPVLV